MNVTGTNPQALKPTQGDNQEKIYEMLYSRGDKASFRHHNETAGEMVQAREAERKVTMADHGLVPVDRVVTTCVGQNGHESSVGWPPAQGQTEHLVARNESLNQSRLSSQNNTTSHQTNIVDNYNTRLGYLPSLGASNDHQNIKSGNVKVEDAREDERNMAASPSDCISGEHNSSDKEEEKNATVGAPTHIYQYFVFFSSIHYF